jgi:hypothetical protein
MVKASTVRLAAGPLLAAGLLLAAPAHAQWRVAQETPSGAGKRIDIAIVENGTGHSLRLYSDDTQNVRGLFTIRGGFDTMDPGGCPTYRVDKREPKRVTFEDERCRILPKQAEFTLGKSGYGRNRQLHRIMNGNDIVFRYRLGNGLYRETIFTLRGSKYALTTAVEDTAEGFDE